MSEAVRTYPSELPVVALRQIVVFPLTLQPLAVNRPASMESVNRALSGDRLLFLTLQNSDSAEDPEPDDVRRIGTIAAVRQMARAPNGGLHIIVEGLMRAKADVVTKNGTSLRATVNPLPEPAERTLEVDAYVRRLQELVERGLSIAAGLSQDLRGMVSGIDEPLRLSYLLANLLDMKGEEKQQILETDQLVAKLQAVATALSREISLLELKSKIESSTVRKEIKGKVNLKETPILEWTWKGVVLPTNADCRKKSADDQAAQLYVVWPRFPEAVRSQIIGYIWDTTAPVGTIVKSEKTATVTYVVVRSGPADLGKWLTERRNVAEDYRKIYGTAPDNPGMISLAIDSDDTSSSSESFFGAILFKKP